MLKLKSTLLLFLMLFGLLAVNSVMPNVAHDVDQVPSGFDVNQATNSTDDGEDSEDEVDDDGDGIDDDVEDAYERKIEVESEVDQFRSKSVLKNGTTKDKFEVEFDVKSDNAAELSFEYTKEFQENSTSNATELGYEVKFDEIIEFVDTGLPGYENETVVQVYEIGKEGWKDLIIEYNETSGFVLVNATTMDGVFTLIMKLTSSFLVDNNVTLSPNSLKIDVIINDFNYMGVDTKLSIKSHIKTESSLSIETESEDEVEGFAENETQVGITNANASAFFSWSEQAMMDGQVVDVLSSSIEDSSDEEGETSSKVYFTFNSTAQASEIVWDPKLGVVSEAAKANLPPVNDGTTDDPTDTTEISEDTTPNDQPTDPVNDNQNDAGSLPFPIWSVLFFFAIPVLVRRRQ